MKLGLAIAVLIILLIMTPITWYFTMKASACFSAGETYSISTSYTPWGGCSVTILGTKVRVD